MSTASRSTARLAAVLGVLSAVAAFLLIHQRTVEYQSQVERFTELAMSSPIEDIAVENIPKLRADLGAPNISVPIVIGLIFGLLAVVFGIKSGREPGTDYLGTTGVVFGSLSVLWIGLTAAGAV